MIADLLAWRLRRGEVNRYYFCWGLDRQKAPPLDSLLSYAKFRTMRDARNQIPVGTGRSNYTLLLDDKYLFWLYLQAMGHSTPPILALAHDGMLMWLHPRRTEPVTCMGDAKQSIDVFCKEVLGEKGDGVFSLQVEQGSCRINGEPAALEDVARRLDTRYILQQRVVQHAQLAALYPGSINTLRIVTVRDGRQFRLFSMPVLRTGIGGRVVDNWSAGGLLVLVDPASGRLRGPGRGLRGGVTACHPDTGVAFDGFRVPHYDEALDFALRLHRDFPALHSVGWDIAITDDGPTVIEGNHNWSGGLRIGLDPRFKQDFLRLFAATR